MYFLGNLVIYGTIFILLGRQTYSYWIYSNPTWGTFPFLTWGKKAPHLEFMFEAEGDRQLLPALLLPLPPCLPLSLPLTLPLGYGALFQPSPVSPVAVAALDASQMSGEREEAAWGEEGRVRRAEGQRLQGRGAVIGGQGQESSCLTIPTICPTCHLPLTICHPLLAYLLPQYCLPHRLFLATAFPAAAVRGRNVRWPFNN